MSDPILNHDMLVEMEAEFRRGCARIDELAANASRDNLRKAFAALSRGDTAERDRLCDLTGAATDAANKSKIELWYRIGEKYGISREEAARWLQRISH